ncbi:TolC family protein [Mucilaginibacter flavus]|uniref:TolC family protein n=1 Tax=Mucilaginibacter flavus TaxID=931504 RepID=UPI0025B36654|nr:TolC family protein [Mucilaginibacter flavus]MDN3584890.1 TolC family protein [Mucilaginibacter flavus]
MMRIQINIYGLRPFLFAGLLSLSLTAVAQNNKKKQFPVPENVPDTSTVGFPIMPNATDAGKNSGEYLTLKQCIDYALIHQPALNKALISTDIARTTNSINLAAWLPQVNANGNVVHYIQQSNANISTNTGTTTTTGTGSASTVRSSYTNTFIPELAVSQAILSPSLLYAAKSAPLLVKQAQQVTDSTKIFLVSAVSKSFYNVLLTLQQINVLKEDTTRLGKNLRDTYHQYKGGIVDETDYLQATITLNNSAAQLKQANENIIPQYTALKQLMGYEPGKDFNVSIDTTQMMADIQIDTTRQLQYEKRIEYRQVETRKDLQTQLTNYYKYAYLPTISGFFNYSLQYANNNFSNLLSKSYPSSIVGVSLSIPIFTGFARVHNVRKSQLQEQLIHWDEVDLKSQLYKEYATGLADYKSNLFSFNVQRKNVAMAKRVYFVVNLQYKQGIVAYLNVITAESNLITAEINYTNSLFQLLSSKIDLEKAMGDITY